MTVSISLHILAATVWVGGMFFAYMALRPAAAMSLQPPERLTLWVQVFKLFFVWVWLSIILLLVTGYWMVQSAFNGFEHVGLHIHFMHIAGLVMVLIYCYVFFLPYRRLRQFVIIQDFPAGAMQLAKIRRMVGINLLLGLCVIAVASGGRYLTF